MQTGEIEANLVNLNNQFKLGFIGDLIARKLAGLSIPQSKMRIFRFHQSEYLRLSAQLEQAFQSSSLPENASGKPALNDLLIRLRMSNRR